ncbi:MAG TPA: efflux RND transporter permease subunit [Bacteroidales bacterium]|nr:efflux RND transporter permease subunit [Bacteroidales bacterium]
MKNVYFAYRNPLSVAIAIIILAGIFIFSRMQTSLFPEITFPKIKVIAESGEQPVEQMMLRVTKPLEMAMKKIPELQTVRSITSRGSCEISAFINWDADVDLSKQRIESGINEIRNSLPPETEITVERMNPSILLVIGYTLESNSRKPVDLKYLANYTVKPFLSQVNGVSEIQIMGGKDKEYRVELDIARMSSMGITPRMVSDALNETNFIRSNGYLNSYRFLYLSVTDAMVGNREELAKLVISNNGKRIVTLGDIASVSIGEAKEYIKVSANGKQSVQVAVIKQPNTNLVKLSDEMAGKIVELKKILPSDVTISPYYVQADFVNDSIKSVSDSLWIGIMLALVVAVLFLRSAKASAAILLTIPVTLCLSVIILYALNQTFNIMTLGAFAASIGLIIDDAIVVVEQIHRTNEEHPGEGSVQLVHKAIHYLFPAMVGSSLSTIVIFLPFVLMSGVAGAYFKVMTNAMIVILVCSFFVTWIALPVIFLLLTRSDAINRVSDIKSKDQPAHNVKKQGWVSWFIDRPWMSLGFLCCLAIAFALLFSRLETGFLPEMDEGSIVLDYWSPPGTSLEETDRMLGEVEKMLAEIPEIKAYSRRTGAQMGFFITEPNTGDYLIQLKKDRKRNTNEVIDDIRLKIESTQPALDVDFGQVIGDQLGDLMASVQPVEVKIFGNDNRTLQQLASRVADIVSGVKGTADVFNGLVIAGPYVRVVPDANRLALFGLTPSEFQFQVQTALEGNLAGEVHDKEQFTPVRLMYTGNTTRDIEGIKHIQVFLPDGKLKPVTELARLELTEGDPEIQRENLQNLAAVTARLDNRDLGSAMGEIRKKVTEGISLPEGYSFVYGGAYAEQQQSFRELLVILILACLLVFCVILVLFKEIRIALTVLGISILGISGCYLALYVTGTPLNIGSYTGLIMIVGIIGENAIFTFLQFRQAVRDMTARDAIVYAISTRLRPKLMTALGAIIALMPIALGIGSGAQMHQPLAIAIIGGFIVAMPLLLVVLPTMIWLLYKNESYEN